MELTCIDEKIFDRGNVGLIIIKKDPLWSIDNISKSVESILGYKREDLINESFVQLIHYEDKDKFFKEYQKARQKNDSIFWLNLDFRVKTAKQVYKWIEGFFILNNEAKKITGYIIDRDELYKTKNIFETISDITPIGIFLQKDGKFIYVNNSAEHITGYKKQELVSFDSLLKIIHPEDREFIKEKLKKRKEGDKGLFSYKIRLITKNKEIKWVRVTTKAIEIDNEIYSVGTVEDITHMIKIEELKNILFSINKAIITSENEEELLEKVCISFEYLSSLKNIIIFQVKGKNLNPHCFNKTKIDIYQIPQIKSIEELSVKTKSTIYIKDLSIKQNFDKYKNLLISEGIYSVITIPIVEDKVIRYLISLYFEEKYPFEKQDIEIFEEIREDISFALKHIKQQRDLFFKEYFDPITQLGNRNYLTKILQEYIKKGRKFYLLMLDIYNFRYINENYGKEYGDKLLKQIARRLDNSLRDEYIFRVGSDEFIILTQNENFFQIITNIRHLLKGIKIQDKEEEINFNISVVSNIHGGTNPDSLILKLERTLENAKAKGKNTIMIYDEKIYQRIKEVKYIENILDKAISNDKFEIYLQPIVSKDKQVSSAEALIRLKDENGNFIPPSKFIQVAEQTGQIKYIDQIILSKVKDILYRWKEKGKIVKISVNTTPSSISKLLNFINVDTSKSDVSFNIEDIELLKGYLTLELTERQALEIYKEEKTIEKLKQMGFEISLDDFGTGYSSLSYVASLNVDYIKIDMSFVQQMLENEKMYKIVQAVINIAKIFNIKTVAEGVETEQHFEKLIELGCDYFQGYYFSKPLPVEEFEKFANIV